MGVSMKVYRHLDLVSRDQSQRTASVAHSIPWVSSLRPNRLCSKQIPNTSPCNFYLHWKSAFYFPRFCRTPAMMMHGLFGPRIKGFMLCLKIANIPSSRRFLNKSFRTIFSRPVSVWDFRVISIFRFMHTRLEVVAVWGLGLLLCSWTRVRSVVLVTTEENFLRPCCWHKYTG